VPTVIKAGRVGDIQARLSTVELSDHLAEARAVVEAAKRQAAQVIADAKRTAADAFDDARQRGHEEGFSVGRAEGVEAGRTAAFREAMGRFGSDQADLIADLRRAVAGFEGMKETLRLLAERDVLVFAVDLARKLTFAIGALHTESARANLERAIALVGQKTDLTVRVHPKDMETLKTFAADARKGMDGANGVCVIADDAISPGGCVVRNERTEVDARIDSQLDEAVALLLGRGGGDG